MFYFHKQISFKSKRESMEKYYERGFVVMTGLIMVLLIIVRADDSPTSPPSTPKPYSLPPVLPPSHHIIPASYEDGIKLHPFSWAKGQIKLLSCMSHGFKNRTGREPEKGVVPVLVVRPGLDRWSNR